MLQGWGRERLSLLLVLAVVGTALAMTMPLVASAGERYWVTSDYLNRRTCPSSSCGIVGKYQFREAAELEEISGGWARVTGYYDASCVDGRSKYVDSGNSDCTEINGIKDGEFAEWVVAKYLSKTRPADSAAHATGIAALVKGSDDFVQHKTAFVNATQRLLSDRRCTDADFREMGGWFKSSTHANQPIYFTYCGGMKSSDKIYLDVGSGRIFR